MPFRKNSAIAFLALILVNLMIPGISAVTVSFTTLGLEPDSLQIYDPSKVNETSPDGLIGIYNTSVQGVTLEDNTSYIFVIVPQNENLFINDLGLWWDLLLAKLMQNLPAIIGIVIVLLIGLAIARRV